MFFRRYWCIIKFDIVFAVQELFISGCMPHCWKLTFIALIPKRSGACEPSYFRSISLCTTLYKLCAKLLANRMKLVILHLICSKQGAFVAGRSISNNVLISQEFMYDFKRAPTYHSLMAIKLDMERVYDCLHWKFLERVLIDFGFHHRWIALILLVLRPSFAIMINGTPSKSFVSSIGLH